jgi:hypothetical protein
MKVDFPLMLGSHLGFTQDVDEYFVEDDDAALRFVRANHRTFSLVHFSGAHIPYGFANKELAGAEFARALHAMEAQLPGGPPAGPGAAAGPASLRRHRRYLDAVERLYRAGAYDTLFSLYLDGVNRFMSNRFGPFLRRLLSTVDGTRHLVVLFGDHGEEYDIDSFAHQNSVSDGVLRVPVVFLGAGVRSGRHTRRIRSIDVVPSLQDLVGFSRTAYADGSSLATTIRNGTPYPVRDAFAQSYIADSRAHAQHLKRALLGRREPGSLPHTLLQEVAYVGPWRLVRRFARQSFERDTWRVTPVASEIHVERERPDLTWAPADVNAAPDDVLRRLDEYRAMGAPSQGDQAAPIDPKLRAQLQAMGYRI